MAHRAAHRRRWTCRHGPKRARRGRCPAGPRTARTAPLSFPPSPGPGGPAPRASPAAGHTSPPAAHSRGGPGPAPLARSAAARPGAASRVLGGPHRPFRYGRHLSLRSGQRPRRPVRWRLPARRRPPWHRPRAGRPRPPPPRDRARRPRPAGPAVATSRPARPRSGCARCGAGSSAAAMDLTPAQRKLIFAVVVVALAALGAFLIIPGTLLHRGGTTGRGRAVGLTEPLSGPSPTPVQPSQPAPGGLGSTPPPSSGPIIYQWLPFTQAGLAAAADAVRKFAAAYASYSYTQTTASYERQLTGLATAQLAAVIARGFATPGVAQIRTRQKQVATGTGQITAIRAFGSNSITFIVAITQKVTGTQGARRTTTDYAVTVTGAATSWQAEDLELASAGNT